MLCNTKQNKPHFKTYVRPLKKENSTESGEYSITVLVCFYKHSNMTQPVGQSEKEEHGSRYSVTCEIRYQSLSNV